MTARDGGIIRAATFDQGNREEHGTEKRLTQ
jgi:hypothetical protein